MDEQLDPDQKYEDTKNGNTKDLDSIIENHQQIYIHLKSGDKVSVNEMYVKINKELLDKYDSQIKIYRLRVIEGLLLDYSKLNNEERKQVSEYLTQISQSENLELIVEGLNQVSY